MRISKSFKATATGLVAVVALSAAGATAVAQGPDAHPAATKTILVKDNFFSPRAISVPKNTTLNFVWKGKLVHNVAVGRKIILKNRRSGSGAIRVSRSVTFNCTLHRGMNLAVRAN